MENKMNHNQIVTGISQENSRTTIVIQFSSEKTPGEIYSHAISGMDQTMDFMVALAKPEMLRSMELWLSENIAKVKNAQSRSLLA